MVEVLFPLAILGLQGAEWIVVVLLIVLLFGAAKIPELARSLGRAKGEFEKGSREQRTAESEERGTLEAKEEARVRKAAAELGIPTEGRALSDIKADLRAKMS